MEAVNAQQLFTYSTINLIDFTKFLQYIEIKREYTWGLLR